MFGRTVFSHSKRFTLGSLVLLGLFFILSASGPVRTADIDGSNALVTITGLVRALDGRSVGNAQVVVSGTTRDPRYTRTNPFGYFRVTDLTAGETYTFTVTHKRYQFAAQTLTVAEPAELSFIAAPQRTGFALDPDFGTGGKVTTDLGGNDRALAVMLQTDGKIVAVGSSSNNGAIARYHVNGQLDVTYGTGGKVVTQSVKMAIDLNNKPGALQADNKVVIGGGNTNFDFVLERRDANGALDTTFGGTGVVTLNFAPGSADEVRAVAIQADGKIVAVGQVTLGTTDSAIGVARFNPDGSLDNTFGIEGKAVANTPNVDNPRAVKIQSDGKILICGTERSTRQLLVRFLPNGMPDPAFGINGIVSNPEINLQGYDLSLQRDGKILAIGEGLARYAPDGTLDLSFNGPTGSISVPNVEAEAVELRPDGLILAAGRSFQSATTGGDFGLVLLHPYTGQLLNRIDTDILTNRFEDPKDILVQPDGKILVAGYVAPTTLTDFAIVRYVNF